MSVGCGSPRPRVVRELRPPLITKSDRRGVISAAATPFSDPSGKKNARETRSRGKYVLLTPRALGVFGVPSTRYSVSLILPQTRPSAS
jgi:hypothetical protein